MRLKTTHDLPKAREDDGWTPDPSPRFAPILSEHLRDTSVPKPVVGDAPFRFSDAGKCSRQLALKASGAPREPMDLAGHHVTNLGTLVHEAWQAVLAEKYGGRVRMEAAGTIDVDGRLLAGGSCDGLLTEGGCGKCQWARNNPDDPNVIDCDCDPKASLTLLELKTINGFGFKKAIGLKGPAEGPRESALWQTALNARAHDADRAVIVVLAAEAVSKGWASGAGLDEVGRFAAEWTIEREQLDSLADREVKRLAAIRDLLDDGKLAPKHNPDLPSGARIVDVDKGRWEVRDGDDVLDAGSTWFCAYCPVRETCRPLPAEACDTPEEWT